MKRIAGFVLGLLLVCVAMAGHQTRVIAQSNMYTWSNVGSGVVSGGTLDFNATYSLPVDQTFVRVANQPCDVDYEDTADWTGTLTAIDQMGLLGTSRYISTLTPISHASIADGGSGYVHVRRPVTANPISTITLSLDNLGLADGTPMYVCFRVP